MALPGSYLVVCEGASEAAYLTLLNRRLALLPPPAELRGRPVRFNLPRLGTASIDRTSAYAGRCVGSGRFVQLEKAWRTVRQGNPATTIVIWTDWDLYARNDDQCRTCYDAKRPTMPDFHFSFQNFEDFLAMHWEDVAFRQWREELSSENHWTAPLHSEKYLPRFQKVFADYRKGALPETFLTIEKLNNMRRHIPLVEEMAPNARPHFLLFAQFLSMTLHQFYPTFFPAMECTD